MSTLTTEPVASLVMRLFADAEASDENLRRRMSSASADQRARLLSQTEYRDFYGAMKAAGKDVEYHEIKDMWHQLPWWPEWHRETLGYIQSYLAGPKCFGGTAKPN